MQFFAVQLLMVSIFTSGTRCNFMSMLMVRGQSQPYHQKVTTFLRKNPSVSRTLLWTNETSGSINSTEIRCSGGSTFTGSLTLKFTYSIETNSTIKGVTDILPLLEREVLEDLASELLLCRYEYITNFYRQLHPQLPQQQQVDLSFTSVRNTAAVADLGIVGINSYPSDTILTESFCAPIHKDNAVCTVVQGSIMLLLSSSAQSDKVRQSVRSMISELMMNNTELLRRMPGLLLVKYLGPIALNPWNRTSDYYDETYPTSETSSSIESNSWSDNTRRLTHLDIIILTAILTLGVAGVGLFILSKIYPIHTEKSMNTSVHHEKPQPNKNETRNTAISSLENVDEMILTDGSPASSSSSSSSSSDNDDEDSMIAYPDYLRQSKQIHPTTVEKPTDRYSRDLSTSSSPSVSSFYTDEISLSAITVKAGHRARKSKFYAI